VPKPFASDIVSKNEELSLRGRVVVNELVASLGIEMLIGTLNFGVMYNEKGG
jgi:hypothetical protein